MFIQSQDSYSVLFPISQVLCPGNEHESLDAFLSSLQDTISPEVLGSVIGIGVINHESVYLHFRTQDDRDAAIKEMSDFEGRFREMMDTSEQLVRMIMSLRKKHTSDLPF